MLLDPYRPLPKVETLEEMIQKATETLTETERHLSEISSRFNGQDREASSAEVDEIPPHNDAGHHLNLNSSGFGNITQRRRRSPTGRGSKYSIGNDVTAMDGSSELSRKIVMLREVQRALLQDLENVASDPRDDPICEHSLLRVACFQLREIQQSQQSLSKMDTGETHVAYSLEQLALELAAIVVSIELPLSSGLPQEVSL